MLPHKVIDMLTLRYDGGESAPVQLIARVTPEIKLINPDGTQPPLVKLSRAGDSFFVEFSIYDSDPNDIDHAEVVFFDAAHRPVPERHPGSVRCSPARS